jgi:threonine/homoserine/homoserine lactone efflux protein
MSESILYGLITGMVMSIMLGTVFFALVQNSIDRGFKSGISIAMGVILSDIILISTAYFNSTLIPQGGITEMIVRICGAVFLIVYGINNFRHNRKLSYPVTRAGRIFYFMRTGFLLNLLNPGNFIGWVVVTTNINQVAHYSPHQCFAYYTAALSAIFGMEVLISFGAATLKRFISESLLNYINYTVGVLFIGFAVVVIWPLIF